MSDSFWCPPRLQDLAPREAQLCLRIGEFLQKIHAASLAKKRLLVAFSGGPDSTALLLSLYYLHPQLNFSLQAVHLNHGFRPEAATEALWCKEVCDFLRIPLYSEEQDVPGLAAQQGIGFEEAARNARYTLFQRLLSQEALDWVCTGHHLDDLAEDVLMRLLRGTSWPALGGMPARCLTRNVLRPLLLTPKENISCFLKALHIEPVYDASNASLDYLRNRVRLTILPLFMKENPAFLQSVAQLWQLSRFDEALFADTVPAPEEPDNASAACILPKRVRLDGPIPVTAGTPIDIRCVSRASLIRPLHQALRLRHYKRCLNRLGSRATLFSALLQIDTAWQGTQFPKIIAFSKGNLALITKRCIFWAQGKKNPKSQRMVTLKE